MLAVIDKIKGPPRGLPRGEVSFVIELVQTIKRAAIEAVEAEVPAVPCVGTVMTDNPLEIRLNQRLTLSGRQVLFLAGQRIPARGDRLALLRFAGGQKYLVLGWLRE